MSLTGLIDAVSVSAGVDEAVRTAGCSRLVVPAGYQRRILPRNTPGTHLILKRLPVRHNQTVYHLF